MASNILLTVHSCEQPYKSMQQIIEIDLMNNTLDDIIEKSCNALNIPGNRLFNEAGDVINTLKSLSNNDHIFLSSKTRTSSTPDEYPLVHISIFGSTQAGKSALMLRYILGKYIRDYDTEDAFRKHVYIDGYTILVDILDVPNNVYDDFPALRVAHMRNCTDGFLLVFAVNDRTTFHALEDIYEMMQELHEDNIPPFILVGSKVDLINSCIRSAQQIAIIVENWYKFNRIPNDVMHVIVVYWTEREVSYAEAVQCATKWNAIKYMETSAKTDLNVANMFGCLLRDIKQGSENIVNIQSSKHKTRCVLL